MKNNKNTFYKGAVWLTVSAIILKIIGLIYKVPLSYMLGDEGMGYFNSAYTVYTLFYIVGTAGIPKAISIIVAKSEAECDNKSYAIYKNAFYAFFILGIFLLFLFLIFAKPLANLIGNNKALLSMYAIAPSVLFVCASGVSRGYLSGMMRFPPIAIAELISGISKLALGLVFAYIGTLNERSLPEICALTILGITFGSFFSFLYLLFVARKERNISRVSVPFFKTVKSTLKIAIPITVASAATSLVNMLDLSFVMNGLADKEMSEAVASALYGNYTTLAVPMLSLVSTLITPISVALMPEITKLYHKNELHDFNEGIKGASVITSFITFPAFFFFLLFPTELLRLIFEEGSAILGAMALAMLSPSVVLLGYLTVVNTAHEATGRVGVPVLSLLIGGVVKLIVSIFLIKNADFGILGAPIGTCASYLVSLLISFYFLKRKIPDVNVLSGSAVAFFSAAISASFTTCLKILNPSISGYKLAGALFGASFLTVYIILSMLLSKKTRKILLNFVKIDKNQ